MAFGRPFTDRQDTTGHTIAFLHRGRPTVKVFLPNRDSVDAPISVFWRGSATPRDIDRFIRSQLESWPEGKISDISQDEPRDISGPEQVGLGSDDLPDGRVYISIISDGTSAAKLDLWADGKHPPHSLTKEVGIALNHALLKDKIAATCAELLKDTIAIEGTELSSDDVVLLLRDIEGAIAQRYQ
jgi:hypothetical protein